MTKKVKFRIVTELCDITRNDVAYIHAALIEAYTKHEAPQYLFVRFGSDKNYEVKIGPEIPDGYTGKVPAPGEGFPFGQARPVRHEWFLSHCMGYREGPVGRGFKNLMTGYAMQYAMHIYDYRVFLERIEGIWESKKDEDGDNIWYDDDEDDDD